MAVTWPLPPGSTLADPARPIVFTTERDVAAVSVALGDRRAEERAYRDGAFIWPYLRSQRSGNTFTLVRDDGLTGWPADPKPFVDEVAPPPVLPTGGQSYGAIYELDFTAQPNQSLTNKSAYTIDGKTWYAKNAIGSAAISIINGTGLSWNSGSDSPPTARIMCLPLASISGFNATAPVQVWVNMVRQGVATKAGPVFGLVDVPSDLTDYTSSTLSGTFQLAYANGSPTDAAYYSARYNGNSSFGGPTRAADSADTMIGIQALNKLTDYALIELGYTSGAIPPQNPWNYTGVYAITTRSVARANPMLAIQGQYLAHYAIKKISVLQPRLAP